MVISTYKDQYVHWFQNKVCIKCLRFHINTPYILFGHEHNPVLPHAYNCRYQIQSSDILLHADSIQLKLSVSWLNKFGIILSCSTHLVIMLINQIFKHLRNHIKSIVKGVSFRQVSSCCIPLCLPVEGMASEWTEQCSGHTWHCPTPKISKKSYNIASHIVML